MARELGGLHMRMARRGMRPRRTPRGAPTRRWHYAAMSGFLKASSGSQNVPEASDRNPHAAAGRSGQGEMSLRVPASSFQHPFFEAFKMGLKLRATAWHADLDTEPVA